MTKTLEKKINELVKSKCLRSTLTKILEEDQNQVVASVVFRIKGTKRVKLVHIDGKVADNLETIERCNSRERVVVDLYLMKKHKKQNGEEIEIPVSAQSCPVYGCLDCTLPDCDEECPPGECS